MAWAKGPTRTSTAAHKRWAAIVKRNAQGRCQVRLVGCLGTADHADHVVPVAEGGPAYDPANGQGACVHCHEVKTLEEAARGRERRRLLAFRPTEPHPGLISPDA